MSLHPVIRAGVIALALGLASAAPVQAATFHFGFGDRAFKRPFHCLELTDSSLRAAIRAQGYGNVALNVPDRHRVKARATRGGWVYQLTVHTCTGSVLGRLRLRPA